MSIKGTPLYYHSVLKRIPPKASPPFEEEDMQQRVWRRRWGVYNDVGTLKLALLHRPGEDINVMKPDKYDPEIEAMIDDREQWYFRSDRAPDLEKMQAEHDALARVLQENGVEIEYVECSPGNPSAMFVRDSAIAVRGGAVVCRMGIVGEDHGTGRRNEEYFITKKLASLGMPILRTIHGEGLLEGGGFCLLDEGHAVVGASYRQNAAGIDQLRNVLAHQDIELIEVPLTGYSLHIDRAIVMVDHQRALVDVSRLPFWFLDKLADLGVQTVDPDPRDSEMANNCLAVAPGRVIMCKGADWTSEKLHRLGMEVIQVPYDECHKNGGGIHCSTLPLIRERD